MIAEVKLWGKAFFQYIYKKIVKRVNLILACLLIWTNVYGQELERFSKEGKYGFKDENGNEVIPAKYYDARDFSEGLAAVEITGKTYAVGCLWGYIDKNGAEVIPPKYYSAKKFSEDLAAVEDENGFGYIDKTGKVVIPMKYVDAGEFSGGLTRVLLRSYTIRIYIDKTGTPVMCKEPWISYILQASDYCSKIKKTSDNSESFHITRPYLAITLRDDCETANVNIDASDFEKQLEFEHQIFEEHFIKGLNTLVFHCSYTDFEKTYYLSNDNDKKRVIKSEGTFIIYYDLTRKEIIGYDIIRGPSLPDALTVMQTQSKYSNSSRTIKEKIETRLE